MSLLTTDYKLFTRVIATAFRRTFDRRVHPHQHGFVLTRDIHAVLDYFMAAQATVPHSPELRDAVVLLLDFAKAYDTLDREFLYAVLSRHGYCITSWRLFGHYIPARVVGCGQQQTKASTDLLHVISETKRNWLRSWQRRLFRLHT